MLAANETWEIEGYTYTEGDGCILEVVSPNLRADKEVVLAAVKQNGKALQFASEDLTADKEVVLAAVQQYGLALSHASPELQAAVERGAVVTKVSEAAFSVAHVDGYLPAGKVNVVKCSLAIDQGHVEALRLLVELDLQGKPRSFIALFGGLNGLVQGIEQAEGVAMDGEGNIYVVGEPNRFYVFSRKR